MLVTIFLTVLLRLALCHNIEIRKVDTIDLRIGRNDSSVVVDSAFAGYTFDMRMLESNKARLIFGKPRSEVAGSTVSSGMLYSCHITIHSTGLARSARLSKPLCNVVNIFPHTSLRHRGLDHDMRADALGISLARLNDSYYGACAPIRQRLCPNNLSYVPGACYIGKITDEYWKFLKWEETECFKSSVEVVFLIDGSRSIGTEHFELVKKWVINSTRELIATFGEAVRTQVVQYADRPTTIPDVCQASQFKVPYRLLDGYSFEEMKTKIEAMDYLSGQYTFTLLALERVLKCDFTSRTNTHKIIVVLTDGLSNGAKRIDSWYKTHISGTNVIPFVVAVGQYSDYKTQLSYIANGNKNSKERVTTVDNFALLSTVIGALTTSIASSISLEGAKGSSNSNPALDIGSPAIGGALTFNKNGDLFIGGTGMFKYSGSLFKTKVDTDELLQYSKFEDLQVALPKFTPDSYHGFSIATGRFDRVDCVIAGAPRYQLSGAAIIYTVNETRPLSYRMTILPPSKYRQLAKYFGASILTMDINGDQSDDLLIGAPLYNDEHIDEGRVFVYISNVSNAIGSWGASNYMPIVLTGGRDHGGRFGTTMANAGDLDMDGFQDLVIGAPLTENGKGTVYIYHGAASGPRNSFSQRIQSSTLLGPSLQYFGQSLQGNIDVDRNGYPDIIVGSPKSEHLTILRSRPIVNIAVRIWFDRSIINIPGCLQNAGKKCSTINYCFETNSTLTSNGVGLHYELVLDSDKSSDERRLISQDAKSTILKNFTLTSTSCFSRNLDVKMESLKEDYKAPLHIKLTFGLLKNHTDMLYSPLLSRLYPSTYSIYVTPSSGCPEEVCATDLGVLAEFMPSPSFTTSEGNVNEQLSGNGSILVVAKSTAAYSQAVRVNWTNAGETSFDPILVIIHHSKISLNRVTTIASNPPSDSCIEESGSAVLKDNETVYHNLLSSFPVMEQSSWCYFEIGIPVNSLKDGPPLGELKLNITTTSSSALSLDSTEANNQAFLSRPIRYVPDLKLNRESGDTVISFNATKSQYNVTSVSDIGRNTSDIAMRFKVIGTGLASIPKSVIKFRWPWLSNENKPLLYLYRTECIADSPTTCYCNVSSVNPYQLPLTIADTNGTNITSPFIAQPAVNVINTSELNCELFSESNHTCEELTCVVQNLAESQEVLFTAEFRLWTPSISFENTNRTFLDLKSEFQVSVSPSAFYHGETGDDLPTEYSEVIVRARKFVPQTPIEGTTDQYLIIIISAAAGILFLAILTAILYKTGFFQNHYRKQIEELEDDENAANNATTSK